MMTMGTSLHCSPKRKRDASLETETSSPPLSPTSSLSVASLQEARLIEAEDIGQYSPRTAVAGRLKELAIRESSLKPEIGRANTAVQVQGPTGDETHPLAAEFEPPQWPYTSDCDHQGRTTCDNSNSTQETDEQKPSNQPLQSMEQPEAKPRRKRAKPVPASTKARRKSPPPAESDSLNPLTWSDCEITGHNPTDPNDDGYGINGVGFRPTPAMAWARSRQRQKQVAEWKHREAREAREKRRERREGMIQDNTRHEAAGIVQKKVKFDLG
ncbi:hypothetical protein PISL3812_02692 [Talaromyces islandicus]|uniref:Uncharacterized protein n=1 Tax=Talaromyces islandicus TaxID=28573 RepID=A0A0U1LSW3_TALIS|nr:hypothetical protein PISL3812_02692 [Talaromyces islandicus]